MTSPRILHGPYGSRWAWRVDNDGLFDRGWQAAETEQAAIEAATQDLAKWVGKERASQAIVDRVEPPLRDPKLAHPIETNGEKEWLTDGVYEIEGVRVPFGGACPVQGDGVVDGLPAYYRARGTGWSLSIALSDQEDWTFGESPSPYAFPDGGWLHRDESCLNIERAVAAFRTRFST